MELKCPLKRSELPIAILLIVPYGIEIDIQDDILNTDSAFNRTLWN